MVKIRYEPKNGKRKCKDGEDQVRSKECQEEMQGW